MIYLAAERDRVVALISVLITKLGGCEELLDRTACVLYAARQVIGKDEAAALAANASAVRHIWKEAVKCSKQAS